MRLLGSRWLSEAWLAAGLSTLPGINIAMRRGRAGSSGKQDCVVDLQVHNGMLSGQFGIIQIQFGSI